MNRWIANFVQLVMALSLLSVPLDVVSCPTTSDSQMDMSCCGPSCPCPTGKICDVNFSTALQDRAANEFHREMSHPILVPLYAFNFQHETFSTRSVKLAIRETKPPPLSAGISPQATLRIWLI